MWGKDAFIYCDLSDKVVSVSVSNEGRKYILKKKKNPDNFPPEEYPTCGREIKKSQATYQWCSVDEFIWSGIPRSFRQEVHRNGTVLMLHITLYTEV